MRPDVDGLIMQLEQTQETLGEGAAWMTVAPLDVQLMEVAGDLINVVQHVEYS